MPTQPERYTLDDETRAKPLIQEAKDRLVIVEIDGSDYDVIVTPSSPYTLDRSYGSLPIRGKDRQPVSDEELDAIIVAAREEHARRVIVEMKEE